MGNTYAQGLADSVSDGLADLTQALTVHLRCNHYPPVPSEMVPVCLMALQLASCEAWDALVELPEGVSWKSAPHAPVHAIVESYHLFPFLSEGEEE